MGWKARMRFSFLVTCCVIGSKLGALPGYAEARNLYVANERDGSVSVIDTRTNMVVGTPIQLGLGARPTGIAITPDGKRAYVANNGTDDVAVVDTATNQVVGRIGVGDGPREVAISPDGATAYVTDNVGSTVSAIDTRANQVVGPAIPRSISPFGIAIAPDGSALYVSSDAGVSVIGSQTRQEVVSIMGGSSPTGIAITPDGRTAYLANFISADVFAIDTRTNQVVGSPIPIDRGAEFLAIAPSGRAVYTSNRESNSVSAIDIPTGRPIASIPVGTGPSGIAVDPNGRTVYVANRESSSVSAIETRTHQVVIPSIPVGAEPQGIAIVPNQPPAASLSFPRRARPGVPVAFDASASRDPDGSITSFAWAFDGAAPIQAGPTLMHSFPRPGRHEVTLTLTDEEGCSTTLVFTGQTASCNGSAVASKTVAVKVVYPGVRVRCPARARPRRCGFQLQVVTKARRGKPMSKIARAKARAGKSAIVSLKPKRRFAKRLAGAKKVLVRRTVKVGGSQHTTYRRLKIVR
jgi:YVTN family beta-propeller protein